MKLRFGRKKENPKLIGSLLLRLASEDLLPKTEDLMESHYSVLISSTLHGICSMVCAVFFLTFVTAALLFYYCVKKITRSEIAKDGD